MVVGLPRSGTTWAANWLTTATTLCVHDPLRLAPLADWDACLAAPGRLAGVSCTGAWFWPDRLSAHPARKLILHRPRAEVEASLQRLGLPMPPHPARLDRVEGLHVEWSGLFDPAIAARLWDHLTGLPFDVERHAVLREMVVHPRLKGLSMNAHAVRDLVAELRASVGEG